MAAIADFVSGMEPICPETIPETLRMDGHYLRDIQKRFNRIVDSAVMLVVATKCIIGRDNSPSSKKREVMAALESLVTGESDTVQISADFFDELQLAGVLADSVARKKLCESMLTVVDNTKSRIRQRM
jgi:hypothetical protein